MGEGILGVSLLGGVFSPVCTYDTSNSTVP